MGPLSDAFNAMSTNLFSYLHDAALRRAADGLSRPPAAKRGRGHAPALMGRRRSGPIDGSRRAFAVAALQAEAPVPSQCPLDATIFALQAADVLADALLEEGLPGHELKAEPVLDHRESSA